MDTFRKVVDISRKIVIGYVFYTFLLTLMAFVILPKLQTKSTAEVMDLILSNPIYTVAVVQIFIWSLTSCFLSFFMFFSKNTREILVKKLSGIKERDEREVQIVGKAFRASYLGTMTILLFVLFISLHCCPK